MLVFFAQQIYTDDVDSDLQLSLSQLSPSQLRHFAKESQSTGDFQQALQYHLEVQHCHQAVQTLLHNLGQLSLMCLV